MSNTSKIGFKSATQALSASDNNIPRARRLAVAVSYKDGLRWLVIDTSVRTENTFFGPKGAAYKVTTSSDDCGPVPASWMVAV